MKKLFIISTLALLCVSAPGLYAQKLEQCVVCKEGPLFGTICTNCGQRKIQCDLCGLPIKDNHLKTGDGRYICQFERNTVIVNEQIAKHC
ncbi:MAG: hypothetical protein CMO80_03335 [Verrucomicrobiales bacterium]|nr:hypothetical protein [Verrucomicrobiales bacterium]|tara:strand:- start:16 stop:285 length:270 start_codon:yes stop_codon:yes gene_type:complete